MILPPGYLFRPTDEELLVFYLGRKIKGVPLPCDVVIERDIYGVGDKAPWQIFFDKDPWEICKNGMKTERTIYVFTNLIKASKNRIARIAGCGAWHAETALEQLVDDYGRVIGYKRMLCFQITNESGVMDKIVTKGHWIMHEYSLSGGGDGDNTECVLCRIKRDDSKSTKKSLRRGKNVGDDVIVPKPAKRIRTEFVQEQKTNCDIVVAPTTEGVPFSEELLEVEKQGEYSPMHSDMVGDFEELDSLISLLESKEQPSLGLDFNAYANNLLTTEVVPWGHVLASSTPVALDTSQDMVASYIEEPVYLLESEEQPSFDHAFDAFGNNPLTPEVVPLGHVLASSAPAALDTSQDMVASYIEEPVSLSESEEQPSFDLAFDAFGNNLLTPEVVPSGHVFASSTPVALDTSQDMVAGYIEEAVSLLESEGQPSFDLAFDAFGNNLFTPENASQEQFLTYLLEQDLPYQESLWSGEPNCFGVELLT
ncbi:hypothetical protein Vadar_034303 [Vaccinium darrowii]|uniref:Uncharacterized protein n=1 Tax=Vaccinium darrowii TaxID=229202 RepID=A0ACB7XLY5_9ERIC|nr:hypothetical protein Vadar_034303 [Vaccinium darrowii]